MNSLQNEQDILKQLISSREAVRKKYKLIKSGDREIEQILTKTFEPITKPLHKLVDLTADDGDDGNGDRNLPTIKKRKSILPRLKKEEEEGLEEEEEEEIEQNLEDAHSPLEEINNPNVTTSNESASLGEHYDRHQGSLKTYLAYLTTGYNPNKVIDLIAGVRRGPGNDVNQLKLGNSDIAFRDKFIVLDEHHYFNITPGLVELIFKSMPDVRYYDHLDLDNYRKILKITNAHKAQYKPEGSIRAWNRCKYVNVIKPLFEKKKHGGGVLPVRLVRDYKVAYLNPKKFYRYWDDPNELCERLKLLIAEKNAGNGAHDNEIHSIIEELSEAGYIS
uniref:DUF8207 domain-containing protein n=1 Tax=Trichogramma kaykai TaxID=54128 RepID=A0ABD2W948_9HYME